MKYFLTLALFACSLTGYTQVSESFNPDYNGDGYVGVDDILGVLSHYDTPWEAGAAENMVVDSLESIILDLTQANDSLQSILELVAHGCIPDLSMAHWWDEWGLNWQINLFDAYNEIEEMVPAYMTFCELASLQIPQYTDCFTEPDGSPTCFLGPAYYDFNNVVIDLTNYLDMQEQYGYNVPTSDCLLALSTYPGPFGCEDWYFSENGGGVGGTESLDIPSGSGALRVTCGGVDKTWNIYIPGSFTHAFLNIGGVNCNYNIYYNPNTTTLVGSVGGIDNNSNYFEDTCGGCGAEESPWQCGDPVSYQGYDYATVLIGDQCWFAENLRSENYENGDVIPAGLSDSEWQNTTSGAVAVYGENALNLETYGRLYNWYAVDDARGLCPSGWHVPTDGEWMTMEMALGMSEAEANDNGWRGTDQGKQMKADFGWSGSGNGTNSSGFSGLPGGKRNSTGHLTGAGYDGYWWSSSPSGWSSAWLRNLYNDVEDVFRYDYFRQFGSSVRCLKDSE